VSKVLYYITGLTRILTALAAPPGRQQTHAQKTMLDRRENYDCLPISP
jgi:hypothetical protein